MTILSRGQTGPASSSLTPRPSGTGRPIARTPATSRPARVRRSANWATDGGSSTYSRNQFSGTFMNLQLANLKLGQKSLIVSPELPNIIDGVLEHGNPLGSHAESEATAPL